MKKNIWSIIVDDQITIRVHHFIRIKSTNIEAIQLAKNNYPAWTVVVADEQTAGRGRYNRQWNSPAGLGLWFSIILRPKVDIKFLNLMNLATALAIRNFLQKIFIQIVSDTTAEVKLKWPNDILINHKKICGILLESGLNNNQLNYVVIGIGINLNQSLPDFTGDLQKTATSLKIETNKEWDLRNTLKKFLIHYYYAIQSELEKKFMTTVADYEQHMLFKGQNVQIKLKENKIFGMMKGIDEFGHLRLWTGREERLINTGDLWQIN